MNIQEAAISIQSAFRGYSIRKYLPTRFERQKALELISNPLTLSSIPLASCGGHKVYLPPDLSFVLKQLGQTGAKKRFWANWHASHLCHQAGYTHLVVPRCTPYEDFTIEEKQPVDKVTLRSQTVLYLTHLSLFSQTAKEFTGFLLKTQLGDILTWSHPYTDSRNLPLARNDNLPLMIDQEKGKVALIDLGDYRPRDRAPSQEEIRQCVATSIALFPYHLEEIYEASGVNHSDFLDLSLQTQALFQKICLGKEVSRQLVIARESLEKDLSSQLERGEIIYYNFYHNRSNKLMVIIHK